MRILLGGVFLFYFSIHSASACDVNVQIFEMKDDEKVNKGTGCIEISSLDIDDEGREYRTITATDRRPPHWRVSRKTHTARVGEKVTLLSWGIIGLIKLKAISTNEGELRFRGGERRRMTISDSGVPRDPEDRNLCIRVRGGKLNTRPLSECADL